MTTTFIPELETVPAKHWASFLRLASKVLPDIIEPSFKLKPGNIHLLSDWNIRLKPMIGLPDGLFGVELTGEQIDRDFVWIDEVAGLKAMFSCHYVDDPGLVAEALFSSKGLVVHWDCSMGDYCDDEADAYLTLCCVMGPQPALAQYAQAKLNRLESELIDRSLDPIRCSQAPERRAGLLQRLKLALDAEIASLAPAPHRTATRKAIEAQPHSHA